ncbi:MAG TPA: hypothetical protein DEP45_14855, partial [Armatimonadetes bacterium]|nr:hypothetical protein [Armatimonadota bacterium]
WVLLKLEGREGAGHRPLEAVREEVQARIVRMKMPAARVTISDDGLQEATMENLKHAPPPERPSLLPVALPQ